MSAPVDDEITSYVQAVRAALAGLPAATVDELLEDLPEHLAEVRAEGAGALRDRLGAPEAYAAELRATAGYVGGFPEPPERGGPAWRRAALANVRQVIDRVDLRVGPVIGYERAGDFLILLRPAWWMLRGYLVAMAIVFLFDRDRGQGLLPRLGGSTLLSVLLLAGCLVASILIGKQAASWTAGPRYALRAGAVLLAIFAFSGFVTADRAVRYDGSHNVSTSYDTNPYSNVRDVFVYDSQGHLVPGARLFDQDGSPIQLGPGLPMVCTDPQTGEGRPSHSLGYPYCPQDVPFGQPSASGSAPSGSGSPSSGPPESAPFRSSSPSSGPSGFTEPSPSGGSAGPVRPSGSPSPTVRPSA